MQLDPDIKEVITKYFTFSRREYKAALALLILTFCVWSFSDIENYFFPKKFDASVINQKAAELDVLQGYKEDESTQNENKIVIDKPRFSNEQKTAPIYFTFNPNTTNDDEYRKLGLSSKQIHIIKNYISKVGEIKSKADFRKIYGISQSQYEALSPYINLPETRPEKQYENHERKAIPAVALRIELNTADSNDLDKLPRIGMGYARRIIKYRNALGGFLDISQLMEVYGFRETLLDSISPFLTVDLTKIVMLNINTASVEDLRKHPYIRYKIANAIVNYRLQHGNFSTPDDVRNVILVTEEIYTKIKSYITVD
jgi:competence protein ComEA